MAKYKSTMDIVAKNKGNGVIELSVFINGRLTTASEIPCKEGEHIIVSRELVADRGFSFNTTINLDPSGDEKFAQRVEYKTRFN